MIVCTGRNNHKGDPFQGEAAPRNVFVNRTAKSTTKEKVEACLAHYTGIKGKATCVTPQERRETAFSLSWRVEVPAADLKTALLPSSWVEGWGVKEYFFARTKKSREPAEFKVPTEGGNAAVPAGGVNGAKSGPNGRPL